MSEPKDYLLLEAEVESDIEVSSDEESEISDHGSFIDDQGKQDQTTLRNLVQS